MRERWLKGNALAGKVAEGEWPAAKGVVRRTVHIAPRMIDFCLQLSAYGLQSIGIIAIINN